MNNVGVTGVWTTTPITLEPNAVVTLAISYSYTRGANYAFTVVTAKNNPFGPYTVSAPS